MNANETATRRDDSLPYFALSPLFACFGWIELVHQRCEMRRERRCNGMHHSIHSHNIFGIRNVDVLIECLVSHQGRARRCCARHIGGPAARASVRTSLDPCHAAVAGQGGALETFSKDCRSQGHRQDQ